MHGNIYPVLNNSEPIRPLWEDSLEGKRQEPPTRHKLVAGFQARDSHCQKKCHQFDM